jgi:3-oxoadipate enol-lactonase/3-oxoadipate enol-lactonase/4-carboxymuconolactone decarboxylase
MPSGNSMPLILLTPIGLDRGVWRFGDLLEHPAAIAHEYPGFGSRLRANVRPTMRSLADDIARSYDGPLDLVGVSMGGMVAQHMCIRYPERVRSAVIACTGADVNARTIATRARTVLDDGMRGVVAEILSRWFTADVLARRPAHPGVQYARETLLALEPESFADGWAAMTTHNARAGLPSVRAKVTVIAGEDDIVAGVGRCDEVARLITGARLITMPGPHMLPLEHGIEFASIVRQHLANVANDDLPRAGLGVSSPEGR